MRSHPSGPASSNRTRYSALQVSATRSVIEPSAGPARRGFRGSRARSAALGAVWRSRRTPQERAASNTTSATARALLLVGGVGPGVVELMQHVGVDPARAPLAVVGFGRPGPLDRHVVRMDLGRDAVEQDSPLAANRGRTVRRASPATAPSTPPPALRGPGSGPARPDRQRPSDAARMASDRSCSAASPAADGPNRVGKVVRHAAGSVVSPFITARARIRCSSVASASRSAARATSGSAWIPA